MLLGDQCRDLPGDSGEQRIGCLEVQGFDDLRAAAGRFDAPDARRAREQPPMLIVWGKNDVIFPPSGANAYLRELPQAELHLLDTGHFALEEKGTEIARLMLEFLDRKLTRP